jgi:hypothetical protein
VLEPFDAHATTGPTLILPVSAAIRVFGNQAWVPGAVHVVLWTMLLVAAWRALGPMAPRDRAALVGSLFLAVVYAVSPYHLEHWYAMLGEVPAALTLLLGLAVWAVEPGSRRRCFLAGVLWSMAILAKMLAFLYVVTFVFAALALGLRGGPPRLLRSVAPIIAGLLFPLLAFEAWKIISIGPEQYLSHLWTLVGLVSTYGTSGTAFSLAKVAARLDLFDGRFGASLLGLLALAVLGAATAWKSGSPAFRRLHLILLSGVAVHAAYWVVLSYGWPRYLYIGVVLSCALAALPFLALERTALACLYTAALLLALVGTAGRLQYPLAQLGEHWFSQSTTRRHQASVSRFLGARLDRRPFVGQWWAPVADLEYLSKEVLAFKGYRALSAQDLSRGVLIVTNTRFDNASDTAFSSLIAGCGAPVMEAVPYAVYECGGQAVPDYRALPTNAGEGPPRIVPMSTAPMDSHEDPIRATAGCNVERVGEGEPGTPVVTLTRGDALRLSGWVVDERERRVPVGPLVALRPIIGGATWYAPLSVGLPRPDVAGALHDQAYRSSGFSLFIDTSALPRGEYGLFLFYRNSGSAFVCDNGRRVVLR